MKKSILYILAASAVVLMSCDDFLDKDPRDTFTASDKFWSNTNMVSSYCNGFYYKYGDANDFYFPSLNDDQDNPVFDNWTFVAVPGKSTYWSNNFTTVRQANYIIDGVKRSSMNSANKNLYEAIGRLNRAWAYYNLVRAYGDVQWENTVIESSSDEAVYGERTDRDIVMDSVLADLDFAIQYLPSQGSDRTQFCKQMALAVKSDVCLYEGTYCKYRTQTDNGKAPDATRAAKYFKECTNASEALMDGTYKLTTNYGEIYNSLELNGNSEIIFYKNYQKDVLSHGLCDYTSGSTTQRGISKDCIDAFLFLDGKPKATTTLDTDDKAVLESKTYTTADGSSKTIQFYSIGKLLANKDKRLSVLVDSVICFSGHGWIRPNTDDCKNPSTNYQVTLPAEMTSSTGYTIRKYDNSTLENYYRTNTNTNYTDIPLYWYAVILLNEAEAKAELGTITQTDLNKTVNLLQARAGLPNMTLQPEADPANNMGVSNLLWEIRRCRRCELTCDKNYRYWDMVRWHQLDKLDSKVHTDINRGANISNVTDLNSGVSRDDNGYIIATKAVRTFSNKYYFYPVPDNELNLNKSIKQNPNW